MNAIPISPETKELAKRVVWFEPPEQALADPVRFVTYALTYGTPEDVATLRTYLTDDDLREALDAAPPGIFDPRSWTYWNLKLGRHPAPPMPQRIVVKSSR